MDGGRKNMSGGTLAFGLLGAFALGQQVDMWLQSPNLLSQTSHISRTLGVIGFRRAHKEKIKVS